MTHLVNDFYVVYLPATNCWSQPQFYFTITGDGGTTEVAPHHAPEGNIYTATVTVPFSQCNSARGDHNGDGSIDLTDYSAFPECLAGPNEMTPPACEVFDFSEDGHVAIDDYAALQRDFN
jgi:hypothetical protein